MRRRAVLIALITALALFAGSAQAAAQKVIAPPGNSGVDEYLETIPTPEGGGPASTQGSGAPLPAATLQALRRFGSDGRAVRRLAVPQTPRREKRSPAPLPSASGSPVASAAEHAVLNPDGGGMGFALPVVLGASFLAAASFVLLRRRRA